MKQTSNRLGRGRWRGQGEDVAGQGGLLQGAEFGSGVGRDGPRWYLGETPGEMAQGTPGQGELERLEESGVGWGVGDGPRGGVGGEGGMGAVTLRRIYTR